MLKDSYDEGWVSVTRFFVSDTGKLKIVALS